MDEQRHATALTVLTDDTAIQRFRYEGLSALSEDEIKKALDVVLKARGWRTDVRYGHLRGIDLLATRAGERLVIEAKGEGSLNPMRVNYFLGALGELLQRMETPDAHYALAFPAHRQFVKLSVQLPAWVKQRLALSFFFVRRAGDTGILEVGVTPSYTQAGVEWLP